jgi:Na+-driven multidrug efflux pump
MGPAGMWIGMIAGLSVAAVLLLRRFNHTSKRFLL